MLFGWDPIFLAAGTMTGLRTSISIMLGGTLCWAVYVPILQHYGVITPVPKGEHAFRHIVQWTLWGGAACMVTSGIFSFAVQWRSMIRTFGSLTSVFTRDKTAAVSKETSDLRTKMAAIEAPLPGFSPDRYCRSLP